MMGLGQTVLQLPRPSWDPLNTNKIDEWPMSLYSDGGSFYMRDNS
jgi:hypothetical protein